MLLLCNAVLTLSLTSLELQSGTSKFCLAYFCKVSLVSDVSLVRDGIRQSCHVVCVYLGRVLFARIRGEFLVQFSGHGTFKDTLII